MKHYVSPRIKKDKKVQGSSVHKHLALLESWYDDDDDNVQQEEEET